MEDTLTIVAHLSDTDNYSHQAQTNGNSQIAESKNDEQRNKKIDTVMSGQNAFAV